MRLGSHVSFPNASPGVRSGTRSGQTTSSNAFRATVLLHDASVDDCKEVERVPVRVRRVLVDLT